MSDVRLILRREQPDRPEQLEQPARTEPTALRALRAMMASQAPREPPGSQVLPEPRVRLARPVRTGPLAPKGNLATAKAGSDVEFVARGAHPFDDPSPDCTHFL
jgi:hypothetical protein